MKDQRKSEIKVGIMTIVGIIIFLAIFGWAKNLGIAHKEKDINIKFENASGLEVGDKVTINGVSKGYVDNITIKGQDVYIIIKVDRDADIRENAIFAITMLDLMGGKKIDINPGNSSVLLDYNKLQTGTTYADIPEVMAMVGKFKNDIPEIINQVKISLTALNGYLNDKEINSNLKTSLSGLTELTKKLNAVVDENKGNIKSLAQNSVELTKEAKSFISDNKENISTSLNNLQDLLKESQTMVKKVNTLLEQTEKKNNNLGKIMYDDKILDDLKETLKQVKDLTKILNDQLQNKGLKVKADVDLF